MMSSPSRLAGLLLVVLALASPLMIAAVVRVVPIMSLDASLARAPPRAR